MRRIRGNAISMIFQEPMTSLDPVMTVGRQIAETIEIHQGLPRKAALAARWQPSSWCACPSPPGGRGNIPSSSPAGCASG